LQTAEDAETNNVWKTIYEKSLESYAKVYLQLMTSPKLEIRGESYYAQFIDDVKELLGEHIMLEDDGRQVIMCKNGDTLTYCKSSEKGNAYTYETTDVVALWHRLIVLHADEIYYVVDSGQSKHFEKLFNVGKEVGWITKQNVKHIQFGIIQSDGSRIKSRDGNTPKLATLVSNAINATRESSSKKSTEDNMYIVEKPELDDTVVEKLAIGSMKYFDLAMCRTSNYEFNFERMLRFTGNTYIYMSYGLARCNSILNKLEGLNIFDNVVINESELTKHDVELLRHIAYFPDCIAQVINVMAPHHLCNHLYTMVDSFHKNYTYTRCIEFDSDNNIISVNRTRCVLYMLVKHVIETCFNLLGMPVINEKI
jgi:arginyl-tRNA synthetase